MTTKPLKKVISLIKEMMVANAAGTGGGFSGSSDAKGPTAGFDPVIKPRKRYIYQRGVRKNWKKDDGKS
tara:strand:- start:34 stop:240 length:207 start_codon:yes stop_codon:yes gene_type:complete